jgi:hypothetical protein
VAGSTIGSGLSEQAIRLQWLALLWLLGLVTRPVGGRLRPPLAHLLQDLLLLVGRQLAQQLHLCRGRRLRRGLEHSASMIAKGTSRRVSRCMYPLLKAAGGRYS